MGVIIPNPTVKTEDGATSVTNVKTIEVTDGTLTDDGGRVVSVTTGGGGGGSGTVTSVSGTAPIASDGSTTTPTLSLNDGGVSTVKIADDAVTNAKIGASAVGTTEITDEAVSTAKIADDAVTNAKIGASAVNTTEIADDAVSTAKIAASAVGTTELADNAVSTAKIEDFAITSDQIAGSAVINARIANSTIVASAKLDAGAITSTTTEFLRADDSWAVPAGSGTGTVTSVTGTAPIVSDGSTTTPAISLADAGVVEAKLADAAVTSAKINDTAVTTAKLGDNSVNNSKVIDGSIVASTKLTATGVDDDRFLRGDDTWAIPAGTGTVTSVLGTSPIASDGSTTTPTLSLNDGGVATVKIADDAVTNAKIGASAVGTTEIVDDAISTAKIGEGAVTSAKIGSGEVKTANMADGDVTNVKIADDTIVASDKINAGAISSATTEFLRADDSWAVPAGGGGGDNAYTALPSKIDNTAYDEERHWAHNSFPYGSGGATTVSLTRDSLYAVPIVARRTSTFKTMLFELSSAPPDTEDVNVGIYENGSDGLPAALLGQGNVSTDASGVHEVTLVAEAGMSLASTRGETFWCGFANEDWNIGLIAGNKNYLAGSALFYVSSGTVSNVAYKSGSDNVLPDPADVGGYSYANSLALGVTYVD